MGAMRKLQALLQSTRVGSSSTREDHTSTLSRGKRSYSDQVTTFVPGNTATTRKILWELKQPVVPMPLDTLPLNTNYSSPLPSPAPVTATTTTTLLSAVQAPIPAPSPALGPTSATGSIPTSTSTAATSSATTAAILATAHGPKSHKGLTPSAATSGAGAEGTPVPSPAPVCVSGPLSAAPVPARNPRTGRSFETVTPPRVYQ